MTLRYRLDTCLQEVVLTIATSVWHFRSWRTPGQERWEKRPAKKTTLSLAPSRSAQLLKNESTCIRFKSRGWLIVYPMHSIHPPRICITPSRNDTSAIRIAMSRTDSCSELANTYIATVVGTLHHLVSIKLSPTKGHGASLVSWFGKLVASETVRAPHKPRPFSQQRKLYQQDDWLASILPVSGALQLQASGAMNERPISCATATISKCHMKEAGHGSREDYSGYTRAWGYRSTTEELAFRLCVHIWHASFIRLRLRFSGTAQWCLKHQTSNIKLTPQKSRRRLPAIF